MQNPFRLNWQETAGALGDYGTLLPIIIGVAAVTEVDLSYILFFFATSYIITGLYYKLPIPVEPMKAIGVVAIGGTLSSAEIAAAGIFMGLLLLLLVFTGGINFIKNIVPECIIRGIQLGLALILLREAFNFIAADWQLGLISVSLVLIFTLAPILDVSALVVFALGLGWGIYYYGPPPLTFLSWPDLVIPAAGDLWVGFWHGAIPQLPLTLGNAVLATTLLVKDLFHKKVPEKQLMLSMSLMCLISSTLGGFPMCHGAGGLAAQYRFGARTGGSNIISGIILLLVAVFFASPQLVNILPFGALGALLLFSGLELIKSATKTEHLLITVITAAIALFGGMPLALGVMLVYYWIARYFRLNPWKKVNQ